MSEKLTVQLNGNELDFAAANHRRNGSTMDAGNLFGRKLSLESKHTTSNDEITSHLEF